jgi:hypothetical protein
MTRAQNKKKKLNRRDKSSGANFSIFNCQGWLYRHSFFLKHVGFLRFLFKAT